MAKLSVVVEDKKQKVFVDKRNQIIVINNLSINDQDVFDALSNQNEVERPIFLKKALKIGTIALRDVMISEKVDYVKREFDTLSVELKKPSIKNLEKMV